MKGRIWLLIMLVCPALLVAQELPTLGEEIQDSINTDTNTAQTNLSQPIDAAEGQSEMTESIPLSQPMADTLTEQSDEKNTNKDTSTTSDVMVPMVTPPKPQVPKMPNLTKAAKKFLNISYANLSKKNTLDIYLPNLNAGPFPVIIFIHGGGFASGDARGFELGIALAGLDRSYAVVGLNYRLSSEAPFPAAVQDVKAAIRFLRLNAAKYRLDPNKFGVWGMSSGGNLAAMLGTSADRTEFYDPALGNPGISERVQAVVDWFGPINFLTMDGQFRSSGIAGQNHAIPSSFESLYMGQLISDIPEKVKIANPETYIDAGDSPFFIQHGTADNLIPIQQSRDFSVRLRAILGSGRVYFESVKDAGHGGPEFESAENIDKVLTFFDRWLKR